MDIGILGSVWGNEGLSLFFRAHFYCYFSEGFQALLCSFLPRALCRTWLSECGNTSISAELAQMMAWPAADLSPMLRQCGGRKGGLYCWCGSSGRRKENKE